jgi:hypothetical protein
MLNLLNFHFKLSSHVLVVFVPSAIFGPIEQTVLKHPVPLFIIQCLPEDAGSYPVEIVLLELVICWKLAGS